MTATDAERRIVQLAAEGWAITKIVEQEFPDCDYADVYWTVRGGGQRSARKIKKTVSNRLEDLASTGKSERKELISEIGEPVSHLYGNHKNMSRKLAAIRKVLDR